MAIPTVLTDLWSTLTNPLVEAFHFFQGISDHANENQLAYALTFVALALGTWLLVKVGRKAITALMRLPRLIISLASISTFGTGHSAMSKFLDPRAATNPDALSVRLLPWLAPLLVAILVGLLAKRLLRNSLRGTLSLPGKFAKARKDLSTKQEVAKLRRIPTADKAPKRTLKGVAVPALEELPSQVAGLSAEEIRRRKENEFLDGILANRPPGHGATY